MRRLVDKFVEYLIGEKDASHHTIAAYLNDLIQFEMFLKETGHAVILVSHRMQDVFEVCDRVVVLRRGNKIADKPILKTSREEVTGLITGALETA